METEVKRDESYDADDVKPMKTYRLSLIHI